MTEYFGAERRIEQHYDEPGGIMETVANRYVAANPAHPFSLRLISRDGIHKNERGQYLLDFDKRFPDAAAGTYVYAWGTLYCETDQTQRAKVAPRSPMRVVVNGETVFQSSSDAETGSDEGEVFEFPLEEGHNSIVVRCEITEQGAGGTLGPVLWKWTPMHVRAPSAERDGYAGWLHSEPVEEPLDDLPTHGDAEADSPVTWYPSRTWDDADEDRGQFARMFGHAPGQRAFAWSDLYCDAPGAREYVLTGTTAGPVTIAVDDEPVVETSGGSFEAPVSLAGGAHTVIVESECPSDSDWDVSLSVTGPLSPRFEPPRTIHGLDEPWLYVGPFEDATVPIEDVPSFYRTFDGATGETYWRVDEPGTFVRPYPEEPNFGQWTYPIGVTLYGLLETSRILDRPDLTDYVERHLSEVVSMDDYTAWDTETYGTAAVNRQLSAISMLDDCGSAGSTLLEATTERELPGARAIIDRIAEYMRNDQARLSDGGFARPSGDDPAAPCTMWIDDLYMSVPFLCRYYDRTGDEAFIDDAVTQYRSFRNHCYMPDEQVFAHIYDERRDQHNGVPWGRGNGWVLFALSELLEYLPDDHDDREWLLEFFRELCDGYRRLQGEHGLWHQVLTDPESFEETSCTAMFTYAFARGVRYGWFEDPDPYAAAIRDAWDGLTRHAIDEEGNVHGVCEGSGYAFDAEYYKHELDPLTNDTHGIGIVLLAGSEIAVLRQ